MLWRTPRCIGNWSNFRLISFFVEKAYCLAHAIGHRPLIEVIFLLFSSVLFISSHFFFFSLVSSVFRSSYTSKHNKYRPCILTWKLEPRGELGPRDETHPSTLPLLTGPSNGNWSRHIRVDNFIVTSVGGVRRSSDTRCLASSQTNTCIDCVIQLIQIMKINIKMIIIMLIPKFRNILKIRG